MKTYRVQIDGVSVNSVEADSVESVGPCLVFFKGGEAVSSFHWSAISGYVEVKDEISGTSDQGQNLIADKAAGS